MVYVLQGKLGTEELFVSQIFSNQERIVQQFHQYAALIAKIHHLMNQNWVVHSYHVYRQEKGCANWLMLKVYFIY